MDKSVALNKHVATLCSRLNLGNAYCHSVQNLSSFCLSKIVKNKIHNSIIMHVVLHGSLTLREEHKLTVFEERASRKYLDLQEKK
jgi:hypothetical protein